MASNSQVPDIGCLQKHGIYQLMIGKNSSNLLLIFNNALRILAISLPVHEYAEIAAMS
jgi:hypothetical protein